MAKIKFRNNEAIPLDVWYRDLNGDDPGYESQIPNLASTASADSVDLVFSPKANVAWRTYAPGKPPGSGEAVDLNANDTVNVTFGQAKKKRS